MENILKPKGMLCNVKWINEQIVIEQKKTVICPIYFPPSSHLVFCLRLHRKEKNHDCSCRSLVFSGTVH